MVSAFVIVVCGVGGFWETGDEATDIGIGIEEVMFAVEDKNGDLDFFSAGVHAVDESSEGPEEAEGVLLDVVGVGFGLFSMEGILSDLDILLSC